MKTYYIYNSNTDEFIGMVNSNSVDNAEIKVCREFDMYSDDLYALSTASGEDFI